MRITRGPRGSDNEWDAFYDDITQGWITFLHQLRFVVAHHDGEDRRTIFLSTDETGGFSARSAVGISGEAGTRYESAIDGDAGLAASGEVWFTSEHQVGLTIDSLGPGLAVFADKVTSASNPGGGAMTIVTTYGQDDGAFAETVDAWSAWWKTRYPASGAAKT